MVQAAVLAKALIQALTEGIYQMKKTETTEGGLSYYQYHITDRNGVHIDTSKKFIYKNRPIVLKQLLEKYPAENHYHFFERA
jgi:hypothetical protein